MSVPRGEKITFSLTLSGDDLQHLKEFQVREGFPTPQAAMRSLVLVAIDEYPKIGVLRDARQAEVSLARQRVIARMLRTFNELIAEFEAEIPVDRNTEAALEKGQVTFTRENQG